MSHELWQLDIVLEEPWVHLQRPGHQTHFIAQARAACLPPGTVLSHHRPQILDSAHPAVVLLLRAIACWNAPRMQAMPSAVGWLWTVTTVAAAQCSSTAWHFWGTSESAAVVIVQVVWCCLPPNSHSTEISRSTFKQGSDDAEK